MSPSVDRTQASRDAGHGLGEARGGRSSSRSRWALVLGLAVGGALLLLALRDVHWAEVTAALREAQPAYLLLAAGMASMSYFVRSLRWRVLLSAEERIAPFTVFWATMAGYLGNNLLPARAGELVRSALLGRRSGLSTSFVLATALTERVVDAVALVAIGFLCLPRLGALASWVPGALRLMAVVGALGLAAVLAAPRLRPALSRALASAPLPLPQPQRQRLLQMVERFLLGVQALRHGGRAAAFAAFTAAIWLMDGVGTIVGARALNLRLDLPQALLFLAAAGLASAVPSTPGYVGVLQFVAVAVLVPFGLSRAQAVLFATVVQATGYLLVLPWGVVGVWRLTGSLRSVGSLAGGETAGHAPMDERQ